MKEEKGVKEILDRLEKSGFFSKEARGFVEEAVKSESYSLAELKNDFSEIVANKLRDDAEEAMDANMNSIALWTFIFKSSEIFFRFKQQEYKNKTGLLLGLEKLFCELREPPAAKISIVYEPELGEKILDLIKSKNSLISIKAIFIEGEEFHDEPALVMFRNLNITVAASWPDFTKSARDSLVLMGIRYAIPTEAEFKARFCDLTKRGIKVFVPSGRLIFRKEDLESIASAAEASPFKDNELTCLVGSFELGKSGNGDWNKVKEILRR